MPNIPDYVEVTQVILGETAKYFALLLFSVLAIRLWRRLPRMAAGNKGKNIALACAISAAAGGIGYCSVCHSLSLLYYYFGIKAFEADNLLPAASLFRTSSSYWRSADALGREGLCFLLTDRPDQGMRLLDEARTLRKGESSAGEQFYEGLYYFFHEQFDKAVPLLEISSAKADYRWNVTRLLAVIALEKNQPQDAERLMAPFAQVEVGDGDYSHAYVMISLKLHEGKKTEAGLILDRFPASQLTPFWKSRFEKLRAKIQGQIS